jgi:hypothetical protein
LLRFSQAWRRLLRLIPILISSLLVRRLRITNRYAYMSVFIVDPPPWRDHPPDSTQFILVSSSPLAFLPEGLPRPSARSAPAIIIVDPAPSDSTFSPPKPAALHVRAAEAHADEASHPIIARTATAFYAGDGPGTRAVTSVTSTGQSTRVLLSAIPSASVVNNGKRIVVVNGSSQPKRLVKLTTLYHDVAKRLGSIGQPLRLFARLICRDKEVDVTATPDAVEKKLLESRVQSLEHQLEEKCRQARAEKLEAQEGRRSAIGAERQIRRKDRQAMQEERRLQEINLIVSVRIARRLERQAAQARYEVGFKIRVKKAWTSYLRTPRNKVRFLHYHT